jgi:NAD(P)-dependent dehydrogenase (short-subunit alcohol dehydrogenase family)
MLIEKAFSLKNSLEDKVVLLTGAGGGIGFETAKALIYLGAKVIIAEVDKAKYLVNKFGNFSADFYEIDLSDEKQIDNMVSYIKKEYGCPDVIFNNATITPIGRVEAVPISDWDKSYAVNFRAPLRLTQLFLPLMKQRNKGTIVFVSSSGSAPYLGAYEVFKTSQVELCNTLFGELENTDIKVYSIGPGLVKTETAMRGIDKISSQMGMTAAEFYQMNENHIIDIEEAATGFALSVLMADRYNGQEIGSMQVLLDAGFVPSSDNRNTEENDYQEIIPIVLNVIKVYREQYLGWKKRNIFERQWVLRDFKKNVGCSADEFLNIMETMTLDINGIDLKQHANYFKKLMLYYERQYKLLQRFEKEPKKLQEFSIILQSYIKDLQIICDCLF